MVSETSAIDHLSLNEPTDTARVVPRRPKASQGQHSAETKREDEDPTYDLMDLPQPTHAPTDAQPSCKPPYDLSPNALAGNQNRTKRRGRPRLDSTQTKNPKQGKPKDSSVTKSARVSKKPTERRKRAEKGTNSSTDNPFVANGNHISHGLFDLATANQMIPQCNPELITTCPKPPSPAGMCDSKTYLSYQIDMARYLAYNGVSGPYRVGEFLCDIYLPNGRFVRIASLNEDPYGNSFWCYMMTGMRIHSWDASKVTGKPVAMSNGTLLWMEDENGKRIPPEWSFNEPHNFPRVPSTAPLRHPGLRSSCNPTLF
ncbi:hypothetical protein FCULG_00004103 [Fusarium culmorum]|uniref:Uncharacterized protein n=1 Tax=Fusarium culmorum TaxID=5516 RepID=A0A2T4HC52_FUSCU|nr:hypothetical protein FCULG_00004103 [Fusarium culmorum]